MYESILKLSLFYQRSLPYLKTEQCLLLGLAYPRLQFVRTDNSGRNPDGVGVLTSRPRTLCKPAAVILRIMVIASAKGGQITNGTLSRSVYGLLALAALSVL